MCFIIREYTKVRKIHHRVTENTEVLNGMEE
jgi:hypothetical protein